MKYIIQILTLFSITLSGSATAHVRWFIIDREIPQVSFALDPINLLTLSGAITLLLVSQYLDGLNRCTIGTCTFASRVYHLISEPIKVAFNGQWLVLILLLNLLFIANLMMGDFFAPNLILPPSLMMLGVVAQVAAILLSCISISLTGVALILVGLSLPIVFSMATGFDYLFEIIGVGLAYLCIAPTINANDHKLYQRLDIFSYINKTQLQHLAFVIVRLALGAQLITLAFNNKLLEPGAALLFIQDFPFYNFMFELGFEQYTHLHFVFAAGVFEATLGGLLMLGWATRFIALCLLSFFTITTILSGPTEIIGHLPIFGILAILILAGSQSQLRQAESLTDPKNRLALGPA
ncbi:MAG: hypothetical protein HRU23_17075 [Gammaproteobacteria bacterium]|nr:hypothetical protein [Gammaproteobacteria bacterium]